MNDIVLCLLSGGVAAALIKAAEGLITWALNRKAAKEDKAEARKENADRVQSEEIERLKKNIDALKAANKVILHDRIKYLARSYIRAESVSFDDRQDLIDMHEVYHSNGGNGNLDKLMEEVMELPTV